MVQLYKGGLKEGVIFTGVHSSGRFIGEFENKKIYTEQVVPGETANVRLDRRKRGFYCGVSENIIVSSPKRVVPECKYSGMCGGCNWQHIEYPFQLELKIQILANALKKYQIPYNEIKPIVASPQFFEYRNKTEYSFWEEGLYINESGEYKEKKRVLGFHPTDRRDLTIDIDVCYIQNNISGIIYEKVKQVAIELNLPFYNFSTKLGFLRNLVIRNDISGKFLVIIGFVYDNPELRQLFLNRLNPLLPENTSLLYTIVSVPDKGYANDEFFTFCDTNHVYLQEPLNGLIFRYGAKSFFQPNPLQAAEIFKYVQELAQSNNGLVYDLYTGVGTIACHLANCSGNVIGIEGSGEAIVYANKNAELNNFSNLEFICGDVLQTFNNDFVDKNGKPDIVVLDPPRSGTLIEIKKTILYAHPQKIIYVSCNPVSLAFDLTMLTQGYTVKEIQPFDMFPHTHHVETVVLLERNGS